MLRSAAVHRQVEEWVRLAVSSIFGMPPVSSSSPTRMTAAVVRAGQSKIIAEQSEQ